MNLSATEWALVTTAFSELRALPLEARERRLAALAGEAPVIANAVRRLLTDDVDDDFLEPPPSSREGRNLSDASGSAEAAWIGRTVGDYRLTRVLGRGGMGVVYAGEHRDPTMPKVVAVKMLAADAPAERLRWRFARERAILARLTHPNIAALHDAGVTDDGHPYLVMEYVDGERIDSWCNARQLDVAGRLDVFRQACRAVHFAHGKLVVHRDLKPSNMLVTTDGTVKLLDFGIATLLDVEAAADPAGAAEQTLQGHTPFTPAFASPEQLRGDAASVASDVYSLGAVLYRLLTGAAPHALDALSPAATRDLVSGTPARTPSENVTAEHPARCGEPTPIALQRTLRGELDAILLMALRAEPERRYSSAEALSDDLLRYLKRQPVMARPDTLGYRARKFVQRQRALVITAAVATVTLLASTAWSVRASRVAQQQALRAQRVAAVLGEIIGAGTTSRSMYTTTPTLLTVLDSARGSVAREFAGDDESRGDLYRVVGQSYVSFDRPDLALPLLDSAYHLHRRVLGATSLAAGLDLASAADALDGLGRPDSAQALRKQAIGILRALRPVPLDALTAAEIVFASGMVASMINEDQALPMLEAALARARQATTPPWAMIANGEAHTIMPYVRLGRNGAADSAYARAAEALARDPRPSEDARYALAFMVQALVSRGRAGEAIVPARTLVHQTSQRLGPRHTLVGQAQNLLAAAYRAVHRLDEARATFDSAIVLARGHADTDPMYLADMYAGRAMAEVDAHDHRAVAASLDTIRGLLPRMAAQRPIVEMTLERIASMRELDAGRPAAARAHLVRAVEIGRTALGPTATRTTAAVARLAAFDSAQRGTTRPAR